MEKQQIVAPELWLNEDFIEKILRDNDPHSTIVVREVNFTLAVGKGDNYASILHRVTIYCQINGGEIEQRTLIVKSLPEGEMMLKLVVEEGLFAREVRMYFDLLPAMYSLKPEWTGCVSARAYTTDRPYTLVIDDLRRRGYLMAERHRGLDLAHTKVTLQGLARLHGLSLGLTACDPTALDGITELFYRPDKVEMNKMYMDPSIELLARTVEQWEGYERFANKLRAIAWVEGITDLCKAKKGDITVLNHGDFWTNNMLFRYDDAGEVQDAKFIDFQISRVNSPATDLLYFMYSSPSEVVREQHCEEVLRHYHTCLVDTLRALGHEDRAFTFDWLKGEYEKRMLFGLYTATFILPIVIADPEDAPDLSKMSDENLEDNVNKAALNKTYSGKRYRVVLQRMLLDFEKRGVF